MIIVSKKGNQKIYHMENCHYVQNISMANKMYFHTGKEARDAGYERI